MPCVGPIEVIAKGLAQRDQSKPSRLHFSLLSGFSVRQVRVMTSARSVRLLAKEWILTFTVLNMRCPGRQQPPGRRGPGPEHDKAAGVTVHRQLRQLSGRLAPLLYKKLSRPAQQNHLYRSINHLTCKADIHTTGTTPCATVQAPDVMVDSVALEAPAGPRLRVGLE